MISALTPPYSPTWRYPVHSAAFLREQAYERASRRERPPSGRAPNQPCDTERIERELVASYRKNSNIFPAQQASWEDYDSLGAISDYEEGVLDEPAIHQLFQYLVDTGLAWRLQGSYGRTADRLIRSGAITLPA